MCKLIRLILITSLFSTLLDCIASVYCQNNAKDTGKCKGLDIVIVVDVSQSLIGQKPIILNCISFVYDSLRRPEKDEVHLITFSDQAVLFESINHKDSINSIIGRGFDRSKERKINDTYPKHGLNEVFSLVEKEFPRKVGIVLFMSDGEDSQSMSRTVQIIGSLKNNGFTTFNIFIYSGDKYSCEDCMKNLSELSGTKLIKIDRYQQGELNYILNILKKEVFDIQYCSPVSLIEFQDFEKDWNNKFIIVLIMLIVIVGMNFLLYKIFYKKPLPYLWGKLKPIGENHNIIEIYKKSVPMIIETLPEYPDLKLTSKIKYGKKLIDIEPIEEGRVEYLNAEKKSCKISYINHETMYIRIPHISNDKEPLEYEYHFLNRIDNDQPVWEKGEFIGREKIINEIFNNFQNDGKPTHYLIWGACNSGKTSLLRHLHFIKSEEDEYKKHMKTILVEYKNYTMKSDFTPIQKSIEHAEKPSTRGKVKIILFDDYDMFYDQFPHEFEELIDNLDKKRNTFIVFAGQKDNDFIEKKYPNPFFPRALKIIKLHGLDNYKDIKNREANINDNSITLIHSILDRVGLYRNFLTQSMKNIIIDYSASFPDFIERILYEIIKDWLNNSSMNISDENVYKAISKISNHCRDRSLHRIDEFDEIDESQITIKHGMIYFRDIIGKILRYAENGRIQREDLEEKVIARETYESLENVIEKRESSYQNKLKKLQEMGFIIEDADNLISVPFIFKNYRGIKNVN